MEMLDRPKGNLIRSNKITTDMKGEVMKEFKTLEVKRSIFENNDRQADLLREQLKKDQVFLLNLMSSPGSGKTTTLMRTISALKEEMNIGVMEADIDSDVDAATIMTTGVKVIQLHTGGMCHLDADMTKQGLEGLGVEEVDFAILENVGNLVCPAEFDTGAVKNAMILSVPEGDDKPLKYPLMFSICDVLLINKIDVLPYFDFNIEACKEYVKKLNPNIKIIPISSRTGEGMEEWIDWIRTEVKEWNA
jgi:hydrogenase nickel incorporation protein HypB